MIKVRPIAFYLPQFHPIPENNEWWGNGFTEWTNVTKAKPLFSGHHQPNLPADLGFYDLRVPEVREQQAEMAKYAGIEGFCYWHYWFGNGKKILDRPIREMIESGKPDFPFCLCWCNETWSGIWHGAPDKVLIKQEYPGIDDYTAFFYDSLPAFKDKRYITVDGKPLFLIYSPLGLPNASAFINHFNKLAEKEGLKGLFVIGLNEHLDYQQFGFDGKAPNLPGGYLGKIPFKSGLVEKIQRGLMYRKRRLLEFIRKGPKVYPYRDFVDNQPDSVLELNTYPTILTNWDNTPRSGKKGLVLSNSSPELLEKYIIKTINRIKHKPFEHRLLFVKAWNEWAEGNYLEPDQQFGKAYIDVCRQNFIGTEFQGAAENPI
jgi:hypothetical protein